MTGHPDAGTQNGNSARKVGVIGLGAMGSPIAHNFFEAGWQLVVKDESAATQEHFLSRHRGAVGTSTLAGFGECALVVLSLPNSDIVDGVVSGNDGLLAHLRPGSTIVDMGSSIPLRTQNLAREAESMGIVVLDAPVSGGVTRAETADLAVMVGATEEQFANIVPLLRATGRQIIHVGPVGSGHAAKALNNLLSATGLVAAAEVLLVGRQFGINPSTLLSVINASSGRNQATETKYEQFILSQTYAAGFSARLMAKDIAIALDLAATEGVEVTLASTLGSVWRSATESLAPSADHTEVVRYLAQLADIRLDATGLEE